jgi:hypothetical protein
MAGARRVPNETVRSAAWTRLCAHNECAAHSSVIEKLKQGGRPVMVTGHGGRSG